MSTATTRGIRDILHIATRRLTESGNADARREAETLLAHVLECRRLDIYRENTLFLDERQQETYAGLVQRRVRHEPLQYILGTQEFWGLEFRVTPNTLIPRPESELLIETVIESVPEFFERPMRSVTGVDLGTGTGCLAVTLAKLHPSCQFIATDLSPLALEVARWNAARHGVSDRIEFLEGDLMNPLAQHPGRKPLRQIQEETSEIRRQAGHSRFHPHGIPHAGIQVDLIISNPPYIPTGEISSLQPEVSRYEPWLALNGGPDGLEYYRRILPIASDFLYSGGRLFLEIGIRQAVPVGAMALRAGWRVDRVRKDLAGIDRVVVLMKS